MVKIRILVTGGSGLLGAKIAEVGIRHGHHITLGFNSHTLEPGNSLKLDVTDSHEVTRAFELVKPEAVIHAAALTDVDRCEREQKLAFKINVEGTRNVLNASNQLGSFLAFVSTDYVFSGEKGNYSEDDEANPINFYGCTKLEAEQEVRKSPGDCCIVRPSVIYGSKPAAGKVNFALWVLNKLRDHEQIRVITDQWVSPTLNTNLAQMILDVVENRHTGIFHLSGATQLSRYDFALELAEMLDLDAGLIQQATSKEMKWAAKRPVNSSLNVEKAKRSIDVKPLEIHESLSRLKKELEWRDNK